MPEELVDGKPMMRCYSVEEKAAAVRMVRTLRAELGVTQGTVQRVAMQLGYGVESVHVPRQVFGRVSLGLNVGMVGSARPWWTLSGGFRARAS